LARGLALAFVICAWMLRAREPTEVVPSWFVLLLLAIMIYFSARFETSSSAPRIESPEPEPDAHPIMERSSSVRESRDGNRARILKGWWEQRREARLREQREREAQEEERVDEILLRVSLP